MITGKISDHRLILASRSPRRQQLLKDLGLKFDVIVMEYTESFPESLSGSEIARYVAHEKAKTFSGKLEDNEIVITADTIVWCNNRVLGKPADAHDALLILKEISGNTHEVITGVCIFSNYKNVVFSVSTKVTFENITDEELIYYIDKFKPYDKAGAYGIQEWIGLSACSHIEGSYFNVVGLPVQRVYNELNKFIEAK